MVTKTNKHLKYGVSLTKMSYPPFILIVSAGKRKSLANNPERVSLANKFLP